MKKDGVLHAKFGNEDLGRLEPWEYETFLSVGPPPEESRQGLTFAMDGAGHVASLRAFGVVFTRTKTP